MAQIKYDTTLRITDTGDAVLPITSTKTVTYTSKTDKEYAIAAAATQAIWINDAGGTEDITANDDFDFLYIVSNKDDVLLELVGDITADGADDVNIVELNTDVPFTLGSDDTINGYSTADGLGSYSAGANDNVIERIRVLNNNASTATVRVIMVT